MYKNQSRAYTASPRARNFPMARRTVSNCFLTCLSVLLFLSFLFWYRSIPTASDPYNNAKDDSLAGAVIQSPGRSTPAPYQVSDPQIPQYPGTPALPPVVAPPTSISDAQAHHQPIPDDGTPQPPVDGMPIVREQKTFNVRDDIVYDPLGPKPEQIVLLMASDGKGHNGGIENLLEMATTNRKEYAEYHGYQYHFINISKYDIGGAHPVWAKLPAIVETFNTFPDAQWVWWLDTDAMIMSPEIDLSAHILSHAALKRKFAKQVEFVKSKSKHTGHFMGRDLDPTDIDIIVGQDHNGLNAGSFFLRRSTFTKLFIDIWQDPFFVLKDWPGKEQDAFLHLVLNHRSVKEHTALVPQRILNAYPVGWKHMGWQPGDLVVHLAGCWVDNACNERWLDFWNRKETVAGLKANGGKAKWNPPVDYDAVPPAEEVPEDMRSEEGERRFKAGKAKLAEEARINAQRQEEAAAEGEEGAEDEDETAGAPVVAAPVPAVTAKDDGDYPPVGVEPAGIARRVFARR